jgi:hypothetical protein
MKSKNVTYLLGSLALVVWGLILFQIFKSLKGDNVSHTFKSSLSERKAIYNDYSTHTDTSTLALNYPDPFRAKGEEDIKIIPDSSKHFTHTPKHIILPKPPINWSFINYAGFIHNPLNKKIIALVTINGVKHTMLEGENREHVTLLKNLKDSIKILYQGKSKFINMNASNL